MSILYFLEKLRCDFLDAIMLLFTQLGEETAFLMLAIILLWCVDKKRGYFVLLVGFTGILANQVLKLLFRVPRPWVLDPGFRPVEGAKAAATGYSFPSGHTQSAVGAFGAIAATEKNRKICIAAIALAVIVGFSRMYLGVHTPQDVLTSTMIAVALVLLLKPLVLGERKYAVPMLLLVITLLSVGYVLFSYYYPFPSDIDTDNLGHGRETGFTLLGCLLGFAVAYPVEKKWIRFPVNAVWWAQIIKVLVGLGIVLAVKAGLKSPLNSALGDCIGRTVRYFLMVLVAGTIWPLTFTWFAQLGKKNNKENE